MDGIDERSINKARAGKAGSIVQMDDVDPTAGRVVNRPRCMSDVLQVVVDLSRQWPLWLLVQPAFLHVYRRSTIGVDDNLDTTLFELQSKIRNEKLRAAVLDRRNGDEGRSNQSDSHGLCLERCANQFSRFHRLIESRTVSMACCGANRIFELERSLVAGVRFEDARLRGITDPANRGLFDVVNVG